MQLGGTRSGERLEVGGPLQGAKRRPKAEALSWRGGVGPECLEGRICRLGDGVKGHPVSLSELLVCWPFYPKESSPIPKLHSGTEGTLREELGNGRPCTPKLP